MIRLGIDTGGTFTDVVRLDHQGITVLKVRSTPSDPASAILAALSELVDNDTEVDIVHGSTVATNALLERKGARLAVVTTSGFEDVLRIGRQTRRELYNFFVADRQPLVEPGMTIGVIERMTGQGEVLNSLEQSSIDHVVARIRELDVDAVAICLLHSYANPIHEDRLVRALTEAGFAVSASHDILPEYREFERWSTTVVNAYVTPMMAQYLTTLERHLKQGSVSIMQSNGGFISSTRAKAAAVQTILSGPAAGAVGALAVAEASGYPRVITFDMGGTSTDVSLIDGEIGMTMESTVGDFPVRLPMIDIHSVGAGGGSVVYVDSGGALRVGPRSAGAEPGPVCYGKGNELTVTDANLLLGRLHGQYLLGGRMALDIERTHSVAQKFCKVLNLSETALAEGIIRVANANMVRAIRVVSVERGFDPREFALLAFGGAGGMHACEIADMLDITTVLVPEHSGVLSALGLLLADATKNYSQTILKVVGIMTDAEVKEQFEPLVSRALADLCSEGFEQRRIALECALDLRYVGQSYEITVPFTSDYRAEFDHRHERLYGYANRNRPAEIVNLRVKAIGRTDKPVLPHRAARDVPLPDPSDVRPTFFAKRAYDTPVFRRESLTNGMRGHGPAVVAGGQATAVIPPHFAFRIDSTGTLIATRTDRVNENLAAEK
jgi:N-methylhydantoinase A/oxoprolinase/acetone carboxylase beta subunit